MLLIQTLSGDNTDALLEIIDILFTAVVAGPLIIVHWRSLWALMDLYVYPDHPFKSAYWTAAFGIVFGLVLYMGQETLNRKLTPGAGTTKYFIITRLYTCVAGVVNVAACRGVWNILECTITETRLIIISTVVSTIAIIWLKGLTNLDSAPFCIQVDTPEDYFEAPTFYKTSSKETALYILDCVFSVAVVGSLVVFVWRGSWALLDIFLYPEDAVKSCWTSLVVGYALVVLTFAAQTPMRWAVARSQGAVRLLLADLYHLVSFIATVNVWRGVWGLMDIYFFPETPKLSNWCSHIISLVLLILLNCSNSVLVRGVYIDAEEPAGDCVVFPCHYLRLYLHKERIKKRHKDVTQSAKETEEANVPLQMPEEKV
nr:uncharacterized protein LOC116768289 isoform X3 [Danaus plexippus plexippus]